MPPKFPNQAADAKTQHQGRQTASAQGKVLRQPHGNYSHDSIMIVQVAAVHNFNIDGNPPSVDVYPNGAQNLSSTSLMLGVQYLDTYVPNVGDVCIMLTQPTGKARSLRFILGHVAANASPKELPLGTIDSTGRYIVGNGGLWGGPYDPNALGPSGTSNLGAVGDRYWRTGTAGVPGDPGSGHRDYIKTGTAHNDWTAYA